MERELEFPLLLSPPHPPTYTLDRVSVMSIPILTHLCVPAVCSTVLKATYHMNLSLLNLVHCQDPFCQVTSRKCTQLLILSYAWEQLWTSDGRSGGGLEKNA